MSSTPQAQTTPAPVPPPAPSTQTPFLTSARAARLLLGRYLYPRYQSWQTTMSHPSQAVYFKTPKEWQKACNSLQNAPIGEVPPARVYRAFFAYFSANYLSGPRPGQPLYPPAPSKSNAIGIRAHVCGHQLHPGHPNIVAAECPVCIIQRCTMQLHRIARIWDYLGGPEQLPGVECQRGLVGAVRRVWYVEKARWTNIVSTLQESAWCEREYARRVGVEVEVRIMARLGVVMTCATALREVRWCPYLDPLSFGEILGRSEDEDRSSGRRDSGALARSEGKRCHAAVETETMKRLSSLNSLMEQLRLDMAQDLKDLSADKEPARQGSQAEDEKETAALIPMKRSYSQMRDGWKEPLRSCLSSATSPRRRRKKKVKILEVRAKESYRFWVVVMPPEAPVTS